MSAGGQRVRKCNYKNDEHKSAYVKGLNTHGPPHAHKQELFYHLQRGNAERTRTWNLEVVNAGVVEEVLFMDDRESRFSRSFSLSRIRRFWHNPASPSDTLALLEALFQQERMFGGRSEILDARASWTERWWLLPLAKNACPRTQLFSKVNACCASRLLYKRNYTIKNRRSYLSARLELFLESIYVVNFLFALRVLALVLCSLTVGRRALCYRSRFSLKRGAF